MPESDHLRRHALERLRLAADCEQLARDVRGLHGVGSFVVKLCILALVAGLFFVPVFAMLFVPISGAIWLGHFFNKAELVWVIAFFVIMGMIGSYVAPYILPQIRAALMALLAEPQSAPEKGDPDPGLK